LEIALAVSATDSICDLAAKAGASTPCRAHVLRRFRDAVVDFPEAQIMLAWIQDLYRIDQRRGELDTSHSRAPASCVPRASATR
jgi:hypothetical protein